MSSIVGRELDERGQVVGRELVRLLVGSWMKKKKSGQVGGGRGVYIAFQMHRAWLSDSYKL